MKCKKIYLVFVVLTLLLVLPHAINAQDGAGEGSFSREAVIASGDNFRIRESVLANAAVVVSDDNYRIVGTVGQALAGISSGFWIQARELAIIEQQLLNIPKEFGLEQNYPNPFNPTTTIQFSVPNRSSVTLKIFDILGREVATLVDDEREPGEYKVQFDASAFASGVYFYRIHARAADGEGGETFVRTKKLMLLK